MNEQPRYSDLVTRRLVRALLIAGVILTVGAAIWMVSGLFGRIHATAIVIVFAILFSYAVYPPIKAIAARGVPLIVAAIVVYVVIALIVVGAAAWLAPALGAQVTALVHDFPHLIASAQAQIADPTQSTLLQKLPAPARIAIAENAGKVGTAVSGVAGALGSNVLGILTGTGTTIIDIFLILVLTLMIVTDLAEIQKFSTRLVPRAYRPMMLSFMSDVDKVIGGFVRGQLLVAFGVAVLSTLAFLIIGVPYAVLVGLVAGILSIVPIVGPFVAIVPVVAIAFFTVGLVKTIVVFVVFAIIIAIQQNVLPLINARSVGVTPLVVFVALLIGSEAYGILGALLSIPVAGVLRVAAHRIFPPDAGSDALVAEARSNADEPGRATRAVTGRTG